MYSIKVFYLIELTVNTVKNSILDWLPYDCKRGLENTRKANKVPFIIQAILLKIQKPCQLIK